MPSFFNHIEWLEQPVQPVLGKARAHLEAVTLEDSANRDVLLPVLGSVQPLLRLPEWHPGLLEQSPPGSGPFREDRHLGA